MGGMGGRGAVGAVGAVGGMGALYGGRRPVGLAPSSLQATVPSWRVPVLLPSYYRWSPGFSQL